MRQAHTTELQQVDPLLARLVPAERRGDVRDRLLSLAELTLATNERLNLTADDTPELFWSRHIEDALWAARALTQAIDPPGPDRPVLDVGSGGGMPGLVWGLLWPEAPLALMESRKRRAQWLERAAAEINLSRLRVYSDRAETLGRWPELRESFALVTARALARFSVLLELTLPFARVGGHVAAIKAADCGNEVHEAEFALRELGSDPKAVRTLRYKRRDGKPCVVLLAPKLRPTPDNYPRREGVPKSHPL